MQGKLPLRPVNFRRVFRRLLAHFGPQHWWPARSAFEVCVGAILTQNTAWSNVERAIARLKRARVMTCRSLLGLPHVRLARLLRPSGYFNVKARRLRSFLGFLQGGYRGSVARLGRAPLRRLRGRLLAVPGVGRETADSILLYALNKPIFVVDAYTRRIFSRHGWIRGDEDYDELRQRVEAQWEHSGGRRRVRQFNELHALLVAVGKHHCHTRAPLCCKCPLESMLPKKAD